MDQKARIAIEVTRQGIGAREAEQDLSKLEQQAQKTDKAGASLTSSWKAFGAAMTALVSARIIADSIREFEQYEKAVKLLDGSLIAAGQHSAEYSAELKSLATDLANTAKVQDELVISSQATLVQFGALRDEMPRLTRNLLDMSAAGYDLQSTTKALGAAVSGEFDPMRRLLKIDFPEGATRAEKLSLVLGTMEERFAGLAASQGSTTSGLRELNLAFDDAKKSLGEFISSGLGSYTKALAGALDSTAQFIKWFGQLGSNNLGAEETFALTDQLLNLRAELTTTILAKEADAEITADQSAALREYIRTMSTAEDMYRRLAAVRAFLSGSGEMPVNPSNPKANLDLEAAQAELAQSQKITQEQIALSWRPNGVINNLPTDFLRMLQATGGYEDLIKSQMEAGLITEAQRDSMIRETQRAFRLQAGSIAQRGSAIVQENENLAYPTPLAREKQQVNAYWNEREKLITAYYAYEMEIARQNNEETTALEAAKTDAINRNSELQEKAIKEVNNAYNEQRLMIQDITKFASLQFASGFSKAFVDFISGTKDAKEAFSAFASDFMQNVAQMIMQLLILRALKSAFGGALGLAGGGVVAAAGGTFSGVSTVSSPTYFPRFNVLAGEAGAEHLAVFARSKTVSVGGINAIVGNVGPSRLAMIDASHLASIGTARKAADGIITGAQPPAGQPAAGAATVNIRLAPGLRAEIVDEAITGAQIRITSDLHEDSAVSTAVKRLTA